MPFKIHFRPPDRSLESFKSWMQGMAGPFASAGDRPVKTRLWITDEQWVEYWTKFWEKADRSRGSGEAAGA